MSTERTAPSVTPEEMRRAVEEARERVADLRGASPVGTADKLARALLALVNAPAPDLAAIRERAVAAHRWPSMFGGAEDARLVALASGGAQLAADMHALLAYAARVAVERDAAVARAERNHAIAQLAAENGEVLAALATAALARAERAEALAKAWERLYVARDRYHNHSMRAEWADLEAAREALRGLGVDFVALLGGEP